MSSATAISRVTGFVRMWATALALGATGLMSAYSVANNIPNMIYELAAGGIIASLFVPTFVELATNEGDERAAQFASHLLALVVLVLGIVAVVGTIWPQPFIWTQTFRPSPAQAAIQSVGSVFFRFFAIQVVIYGAGMVVQALLNAKRQYLWPSLGPIFNNVVVVITMLVYAAMFKSNPTGAFVVLAVGTTLGVVAMFAVQIPSLLREGVRLRLHIDWSDPALRRMGLLSIPTVIYVATNLVGVSFRNSSAFAVSPKGPSILMYAWTFYQLPYGILAVSVATAVFTELADKAGRQEMEGFKAHFVQGFRATGVLILPLAALLFALAKPLVSLYRVGRFTAADVAPVVGVLRWWAVGLLFFATTMFLLRTFYSLQDTKTPMLVNLALTVVQIGLYVALSTGVGSWHGIGLNGLPIADSVFFLLMTIALAWILRGRIGTFDLRGMLGAFALMAVASLVGAGAAWAVAQLMAPIVGGVLGSLGQVVAGGIVGLGVALGLGRLFRVAEVDILSRLARRVLGAGRRA